jgi:hypothetical protein
MNLGRVLAAPTQPSLVKKHYCCEFSKEIFVSPFKTLFTDL